MIQQEPNVIKVCLCDFVSSFKTTTTAFLWARKKWDRFAAFNSQKKKDDVVVDDAQAAAKG